MKYFEIHQPYYALIKANNLDEATKEYVTVVAGDEKERPLLSKHFEEVSRDYALLSFGRAKDEVGNMANISQVIDDFNSDIPNVLLIDSAFLS